jgi:hypothetical protein
MSGCTVSIGRRTPLLLVAVVAASGAAAAGVEQRTGPPSPTPDDPGPSPVIFPFEQLPLRFSHRQHAATPCTQCHAAAPTSTRSEDRIVGSGRACDTCHASRHEGAQRGLPVTMETNGAPSVGKPETCATCHTGDPAKDRVRIPAPYLNFSHAAHARRNIGCGQCHAAVERVDLATRAELPRMKDCLRCHTGDDVGHGGASDACETCHIPARAGEAGRLRTHFPTGVLLPPQWMRDAAHGPDFIERHRRVAGNDSQFCASCHQEDFCVACHDGRVRPRSVHPNDYLNLHAREAELQSSRCTSCHREQSFCVGCHQRMGVAQSGPGARASSARFHPPRSMWMDGAGVGGQHGQEARRNLGACVSCHIERDCVACHGAAGVGAGRSPHPAGYRGSECAAAWRRNPRPCLVCHGEADPSLETCE